jgi:limonene-1,2-epoxide hydrolase
MKTSNNNQCNTNISIAEQYYRALAHKDLTKASQFLHPEVRLISPLAEIETKPVVIKALEGFLAAIERLEIRIVSSVNDQQTMLLLNPYFHQSIGKLRTAAFITLENNLIKEIELFYDSRPLFEKKNEIFRK